MDKRNSKNSLKKIILLLGISMSWSKVYACEEQHTSFYSSRVYKERIEYRSMDIDLMLRKNPILFHQLKYTEYLKRITHENEEILRLENLCSQIKEYETQIQSITASLVRNALICEELGMGTAESDYNKLKSKRDQIHSLQKNEDKPNHLPEEIVMSIQKSSQEEALYFTKLLLTIRQQMATVKTYERKLIAEKEEYEKELDTVKKQLENLIGDPNKDALSFEKEKNEIRNKLQLDYETHTRGPTGQNLLSTGVIADVIRKLTLQTISILENQADIYSLFASHLELPYYFSRGEAREEEWISHARRLRNCFNRLIRNDIVSLELGLLTSQECQFDLTTTLKNLTKNDNPHTAPERLMNGILENPLTEPQITEGMINLNQIFKNYGAIRDFPPEFCQKLIESHHGLFGLYVASLSGHPAQSWHDYEHHYDFMSLKDNMIDSHTASSIMYNHIKTILGRHINLVILDLLIDHMNKCIEKGA